MADTKKDRPKKLYLIEDSYGVPLFVPLDYVEIADCYVSQFKKIFMVHESDEKGLTLYCEDKDADHSFFGSLFSGVNSFKTEKEGGLTGGLKGHPPDLYREERAGVTAYLERLRAYRTKVDEAIAKVQRGLDKERTSDLPWCQGGMRLGDICSCDVCEAEKAKLKEKKDE